MSAGALPLRNYGERFLCQLYLKNYGQFPSLGMSWRMSCLYRVHPAAQEVRTYRSRELHM